MHDLCSVTYATVTCLGPELMMKEIMRQYLSPQISLSQSKRAATSSQRFPAQCQKAAPINTMHSSSKIIWVSLTFCYFSLGLAALQTKSVLNPAVRGKKKKLLEFGAKKGLLKESSKEFMLKKIQTPWWISGESFCREGEGESAV